MRRQDTAKVSFRRCFLRSESLTSPSDLINNTHPPKNFRMTKPPSTVLISGIPLCLAYGAYFLTKKLAVAANSTCKRSAIDVRFEQWFTHRICDEEKILYNPFTSTRRNMQCFAPGHPVLALRPLAISHTTKSLIQIKSSTVCTRRTVSRLYVSEPVTGNVYPGSNQTDRNSCRNQYNPYLAGVGHLLHVTNNSRCVRI